MSVLTRAEPGLRCLRAPNPGPLTGPGTNTYLLGKGDIAVIDPGPDRPAHLRAILGALRTGEQITHILITHSHRDHSPLARGLAVETGAPVLAFGDSRAGRSAHMDALGEDGRLGGGEGVDESFAPDRRLADGESVHVGDETVTALWTPGHFGNHLCYLWRGAAFSGDHVMDWASTLVSPPDGDLTAFMRSLDRLEAQAPRKLYPGHGAPVTDPAARIGALRAHRLARESAIRNLLAQRPATIAALTAEIYADTPPHLHGAASRNVLAHLIDLHTRGLIEADPGPYPDALYHLRTPAT